MIRHVTNHLTPELEEWLDQMNVKGIKLRSLVIVLAKDSPLKIIEKLNFRAPDLESLVIYGPSNQLQLPPPFSNHFPRLRTLSLTDYTAWPTGLIINLKTLTLVGWSIPITMDSLLDMLEQNTSLDSLDLSDYFHAAQARSKCRIVALPKLKYLSLYGCNSPLLLSHLILSHSCELQIEATLQTLLENNSLDPGASHILSMLPEDYLAEFKPDTISLYLEIEFTTGFNFMALSTVEGVEGVTIKEDSYPFGGLSEFVTFSRNSLEIISQNTTWQRSLEILCINYNTSGQELDLYQNEGDAESRDHPVFHVDEMVWSRWFAALPDLKKFESCSLGVQEICLALGYSVLGSVDGGISCPKLESLNFVISGDARESMDAVTELVEVRLQAGSLLKSLTVKFHAKLDGDDCGLGTWIDQLKELVAEVNVIEFLT